MSCECLYGGEGRRSCKGSKRGRGLHPGGVIFFKSLSELEWNVSDWGDPQGVNPQGVKVYSWGPGGGGGVSSRQNTI